MSVQEALARAIDEALYPFAPQLTDEEARAVVAALAEQGLVVARRDDLRHAMEWYRWFPGTLESPGYEAAGRLSVLAAPGDGGEERR